MHLISKILIYNDDKELNELREKAKKEAIERKNAEDRGEPVRELSKGNL